MFTKYLFVFTLFILSLVSCEEGFIISFSENDIISTEQWAIFTGKCSDCLNITKPTKSELDQGSTKPDLDHRDQD